MWARALLGAPARMVFANLKALVVLALVLAGAPAEDPDLQATVSLQDGVKVDTADHNFGVQLGALVDLRFIGSQAPGGRAGRRLEFAVPLVRPTLRAHLVRPWIGLFIQPELAGTPRLLDLELDVHPIPEFGVKVGQLITPYSRAFLTPVPKLQFEGFTLANEVFRANRDTGALVYGTFFGGRLEYDLGVFNGNGIDVNTNDNLQFLWAGRVAGVVFGAPIAVKGHVHYDETAALSGTAPPTLMLGVDAYVNRNRPPAPAGAPPLPSQRVRAASVDLAFVWRDFSLQSEGYLQQVEPNGAAERWRVGVDAQAGYFLVSGVLEAAARVSTLRFDRLDPKTRVTVADGQLGAYVFGNHLKMLLRYSFTDAASAQNGVPAGRSHAGSLWMQTWF